MKRGLLLSLFLLSAAACNAGYGPLQDYSQFKSAMLAGDGDTIVFSYHRFKYRPASGFRAFPDGGIPKYETDINFLGFYNRKTQKIDVLRREENRDWQPGQGNYAIQATNGDFALVAQGGQVRGPFAHDLKHILVDSTHRTLTDLDIGTELARYGRATGAIYLAASDGTLVFITPSLQQARTANVRHESGFVPEIWVRTPRGEYLKVAACNHYERVEQGDVIYWMPDTREFMAFSLVERTTRVLPNYRTPPYQDVTRGASLTSDRQGLQYGEKVNGQWSYQPLAMDPSKLK